MASRSRFRKHFSQTLGAGLLIIVPLGLTYMVLRFLFDVFDGLLDPLIAAAWHGRIPGAGFVALVLVVYIAGLLTMQVLGRKLIHFLSRILLKVPVIGAVYSTAKQLIDSFAGTGETGFKRVVMLEYPRKECWTIGFLTSTVQDQEGVLYALVYIPTAPTPQSGWVAMVPYSDIRDTDLTVTIALRMVLSGGITVPAQIKWTKVSG